MDSYVRELGLSNKTMVYRPIEFEKYRKPQVVEYPRHAIVLNPHHTRLQQEHHRKQQQNDPHGALSGQEKEDSESERDDDASEAGSEDEDDPRYMDHQDFLCSDALLKQIMHLQWKQLGPVGVGLHNMGNTCFANSVLQSIAYTPALAQYFASSFKSSDTQLGAPYDFAYALGEVIRQVHLSPSNRGGGGYRPSVILGHLRALSSHMRLGQQCDAHEFAVQLLFACQKSILFRQFGSRKIQPRLTHTTALYRICGGYLRSQVSWDIREEMQQLKQKGKRQAAIDLRLVWENKKSKRKNHAGGSNNAEEENRIHSNTYDPFTILNVEVAGKTLYHCLDEFCTVEKLDGRIYSTPREVFVHATKGFRIHCPPPVLIIQLKRFTPTGMKNSKHIQYPKILDVVKYCTPTSGTHSFPTRYELNAITVHEGRALNFGHYYAIVKGRNGVWYECNDSHVGVRSEEQAMQQQAYMLFYSRIDSKPTSAHKSNRQEEARRSKLLHHQMAPTERSSAATDGPVSYGEDLGQELTEEQLRQRLSGNKPINKSTAPSSTLDSPMHTHKLSPKMKAKRMRDELETETDDDDGDMSNDRLLERGDTARMRKDESEKEEEEVEPSRMTAKPEKSPHLTVSNNNSRYGGLVRALKKHEHPGNKVPAVGREAVYSFRKLKQQATPGTVARPQNAPKFQQKIRDPLWEMEMDRGRTKKVKQRRLTGHETTNRFQQESQKKSFDLRGRQKQ